MLRFFAAVLTVAPFVAGIGPADAQQVPHLAIQQTCRGIARNAAGPGEVGGPDLAFHSCVASELNVRKRLSRVWNTYPAAVRAECVGDVTAGGLPSYTDLLTCLQISRDALELPSSPGGTH